MKAYLLGMFDSHLPYENASLAALDKSAIDLHVGKEPRQMCATSLIRIIANSRQLQTKVLASLIFVLRRQKEPLSLRCLSDGQQ